MKHERSAQIAAACLLAFLAAAGTAGCLCSAFHLSLEHPGLLLPVFFGAALTSGLLLSVRRGGTVLLCLLALICGYCYHDGRASQQTLQLIQRLSHIYDRAYGWGVLQLTEEAWDAGFADWPLGILGSTAAMAVSLCICRRKSVWLPMAAVLLPLCACIVVTDTVPGEVWLLMVLAVLLLLLLTASVRRDDPVQAIRLTGIAALPVTAALLILFLAIPQKDYVNQAEIFRQNIITAAQNLPQLMETGLNSAASGLQRQPPKQVDLAGLGARIPFTYPVMEVTAETDGLLYLRGQDYDQYNGLGWTATPGREEIFSQSSGQPQTITIRTENRKDIRYLPYYPAEETLLLQGSAENRDGSTEYSFLCKPLPEDWRQTAYENALSSGGREDCLALPEDTRRDALAFLGTVFRSRASNTEKADLIAALVTDCAVYDTDPGKMPAGEPDFALWFLKNSDKGYCVHFATAAAVLLRAADVPARYVTGYMVEAAAGETVTVTEENAHAWAEYYEPNLDAWIPLEATPAAQESQAVTRPRPVVTLPTVPETLPTEAVEEATQPRETTAATFPEVPSQKPEGEEAPWGLLLSIPLAILALAAQRSLRLKYRRRKQRTGSANAQALQRWREAVRLSRLLKESPTEELIHLAQKAKFSQHTLTGEDLMQFDSYIRSCLRRLKQKPWYLQWVYQYVYAVY